MIAELEAEKGDRVVSESTQEGGRAFCVPTDISNQADVQDMVEKNHRQVKPCGLFDKQRSCRFQNFRSAVLRIAGSSAEIGNGGHINGAFYCSRAVVPIMQKQKWGRIINIA